MFGAERELKGTTGILREIRSDGMNVELVYQGQRLCRTVPRDAVRPFDCKNKELRELLKCGACKDVHFCSRSCQREGWKEHKRFCSSSGSWQSDRVKLEAIRKKYETPQNRQLASESELASAFESFEFFIEKWTQVGRNTRLGSGHQAIQEAVLFAIPIGSLLLWKIAGRDPEAVQDIYLRLLKLVHMNLRNVRLLVPRFHIAHWTALYYVNGLLLAKELVADGNESSNRLVKALSADFERCLDIADVFDPNVAKSFRYGQSMGAEDTQSSQLFQQIAQDPSKLAAFYSIDPELPLEQKMEHMSRLLSNGRPTRPTSTTSSRRKQTDQNGASNPQPCSVKEGTPICRETTQQNQQISGQVVSDNVPKCTSVQGPKSVDLDMLD